MSIPPHIRRGLQYGLLVDGYNLKDYLIEAATSPGGYETVLVDGVQGAGKSNCALQMAYWIKEKTLHDKLGRKPFRKEIWQSVLDSMVFKPADFVRRLEEAEDTLDVLIWDDIQAHYTSSTFKTDIKQYAAVDSTWAVIRTKVHVVIITIPNLTRLAKNVKDNITFEVFVGKNKLRKMMRLFRLPGLKHVDMNLFKVDVEPPSDFNIYDIDPWVWTEYEENMRKPLAEAALKVLKSHTNMEELEGFITITDAIIYAKKNGVNWGANTVSQGVSRGWFNGQKVNNMLCIEEESFYKVIEVEKTESK